MNDKNTPAKSEAPAEGLVAVRSIKDERDKSGLGKLLDELPAPFISLNCVIEVIAEANDGSFKEAARRLRILFESEADFPSWYRWTDAKSKGNLDPENGVKWGPRLIQHAEMVGKPVEFPHNHYRDCGYDLSAMPEGSIDHFLVYGPTIGFQRSDIGPFLTHHGLSGVDAIVVPGGFGVRGIEGKIGALRWARVKGVPALGLCLGLQCMVIEYARNVAGIADASSTEFDPETTHPVIATMEEQKAFVEGAGDLGGTMRLGTYPANLVEGSVIARTYGSTVVHERHRHRYEVNNAYRDQLEEAGLRFSGTSPDGSLVEFVELPADVHPYYVATQAHPEFQSRPDRAHPLFAGLVEAAIDAHRASRLVEVERPRGSETVAAQ